MIRLESVNKIYKQRGLPVHAIADVSLHIQKGEFLALCGSSGSGKTTLLNIIGCLDSFDSGEVFFEDEVFSKMNNKDRVEFRRLALGFIFQSYYLIPVLTAFENVALVYGLVESDSKRVRERVMNLLADVGLEGLEHRLPHELSGGQQQRVAIARALVKNPRLILADEPTANLDSKTGQSILELMHDINQRLGVTFIFSTHDALVMKHAQRLVHLSDGMIQEDKVLS